MRDVQPQIDDYYADLAAREPNVDTVEFLLPKSQKMIDAYYDNMIEMHKVQEADTSYRKVIKQTIKNRLKRF